MVPLDGTAWRYELQSVFGIATRSTRRTCSSSPPSAWAECVYQYLGGGGGGCPGGRGAPSAALGALALHDRTFCCFTPLHPLLN